MPDTEYLAERFELSGGNIKNVVWNALFKAASEEMPLQMQHLVVSVYEEYRKIGKIRSKSDFGKYYYLLDGTHIKITTHSDSVEATIFW